MSSIVNRELPLGSAHLLTWWVTRGNRRRTAPSDEGAAPPAGAAALPRTRDEDAPVGAPPIPVDPSPESGTQSHRVDAPEPTTGVVESLVLDSSDLSVLLGGVSVNPGHRVTSRDRGTLPGYTPGAPPSDGAL